MRKNSVNDFNIPKEDISAIHPLMDRTNSTGCYSRELSLPTVDPGKHNGLKYISHETLVKLLNGKLAKGSFFQFFRKKIVKRVKNDECSEPST